MNIEMQNRREQDNGFAHVVANSLNNLVDEGVLGNCEISQASAMKMDEFVVRYPKQIRTGIYSAADRLNLRTLFAVSDHTNSIQRESRGEQIVEMAREVYRKIHDEDPDIQGFIVFGSRMDRTKLPRDNPVLEKTDDDPTGGISDIDIITFMLPSDSFKLQDTYLTHRRMEEIKNDLYPEVHARFGRSGIQHISDLYDMLKGHNDLWLFPEWGWNPDAVYFTGELHVPGYLSVSGKEEVYSQDEVNVMLGKFLRSERASQERKVMMDEAKEIILGNLNSE